MPVTLAVQPCVVGVIVVCEQSVFDKWPDALRPEGVPKRLVVIAFVTRETLDFVGITQGESTSLSPSERRYPPALFGFNRAV